MVFPVIQHKLHFILTIVVLIGGLAWLGVGMFNKNFVHDLFGDKDKYVYDIVGLASVYLIICKLMMLSGVNMMKVDV